MIVLSFSLAASHETLAALFQPVMFALLSQRHLIATQLHTFEIYLHLNEIQHVNSLQL